MGAGDFVLDRSRPAQPPGHEDPRRRRPEQLILNPKLTEVPRVGLLPGTKAATDVAAGRLRLPAAALAGRAPRSSRPRACRARRSTRSGCTCSSRTRCPRPRRRSGASARRTGGDVVGSFVSPVRPISVPGGRAYEFSLPVDAGELEGGPRPAQRRRGPVAVTTVDAKNEPAPSDGPYISPIYWGADIRQAAQARLGDAFHLGGMHLMPAGRQPLQAGREHHLRRVRRAAEPRRAGAAEDRACDHPVLRRQEDTTSSRSSRSHGVKRLSATSGCSARCCRSPVSGAASSSSSR